MRLIFIRHAEPDYEHNTLTEKGKYEAELLARRVAKWDNLEEIYVSPLPRAQMTAAPFLRDLGRTAETLPWLEEFIYSVEDPLTDGATIKHVPWDFMPAFYKNKPEFADREQWIHAWPYYTNPDLEPAYRTVTEGIDGILARHGYRRDGYLYRCDRELTDQDDDKNLVFVCHFGVTAFILSHVMGLAAPQMTMNFISMPTGVTVAIAEKRQPESALFRMQYFGDTSHLRTAGEPVSNMGAFAKVFQG
ncbi:MAG: histidine phosphatase family protein [Lachnospiraceae bacterium]|nr:histidine phosphatase family protein [Lachnospiraceae bacterium]